MSTLNGVESDEEKYEPGDQETRKIRSLREALTVLKGARKYISSTAIQNKSMFPRSIQLENDSRYTK